MNRILEGQVGEGRTHSIGSAVSIGRISFGLLVGVLVGCEPGTVTRSGPAAEGSGSIPRSTVTFQVIVDPSDSTLADSLGWSGGVPGAVVHVLHNGTAAWVSLVTDSMGIAARGLRLGLYRAYAERVLTSEEARLVGKVRAFGDGRTVTLGGDDTVTLTLVADRSEGLVISEVATGTPVPWETTGGYLAGMYLELYNNGTATVYLDSLILGVGYYAVKATALEPCSVTASVRRDSSGIHARQFLRFPGRGFDYPLPPGGTSLIAVAAADHREVHPLLHDLSHADFEIAPPSYGNNPAVPDLADVSYSEWRSAALLGQDVLFIAGALAVESLPAQVRDPWGRRYGLVPRDALLDVVALVHVWPERDLLYPPCEPILHPDFERYEGGFEVIGFDVDHAYSTVRGVQRRALRREVDGRTVLFNTNTSAVDFEWTIKTPGWVPEPER